MGLKIYQKYITIIFLKNFFIIFSALQLFYLGIDLMQHFKRLPDSANLQILYAMYTFLNAINFTLPISLVFAMIISKFYIIRSNELIAMYALGISKNALIKPIFLSSIVVVILYVALNFTNFAYSKEYAYNILTNSSVSNISTNLFLKYFNNYIYIDKLNPVKKEALGVKIFKIKNKDLKVIIDAKSANFIKNYWILNDLEIIHKPSVLKKGAKLTKEYFKHYKTLKEFKPKIIENLYEGTSNFSVVDALLAIRLFLSQNVNIQKIKASLFALLVFPFFAPLFNLILFYYLPISNRFFDLALVSSVFIFVALVSWGILLMLVKMSMNATVNPDIGIILPIAILSIFSVYLYYKNK